MKLLETTLSQITPSSSEWREKATQRIETLIMPHWALGRSLDLAVDIAAITRSITPDISRRACIVMGADHGIAVEGVTPCPQEVTPLMMAAFTKGGAAINVLADHIGAEMVIVDVGVKGDLSELYNEGTIIDYSIAQGTANFAEGPAMSREQAVASIEAGIEVVNSIKDKFDLFVLGEMGIGNTTASSAIVSVLCDLSADIVTGCGAGLDEPGRQRKAEVISAALALHQPDQNDAVDILTKVGGFEIGAMAGVMLAAAALQKPVMMDGFICTAAALIAQSLNPDVVDTLIAGHSSVERGHIAALDKLGRKPILNLELRLGEGSGAAMALPVVDAGVKVMKEMATFADLGISLS
ncbi:nicotinate-nucleotide--dimethylbenzimidazole phosphoribosyltransferase [Psychromonas aquimarina]|uniref:nicotinate-nucleotide--dimethylbenzimidazole phosphoribosyltransferase n=1 Tax=Psychromonas aquimarina TaxID=444919 RepID=UPI00040A4177|nr:nicotinate-nucleotide--dimethylbenzimidazole phosphoribosyltransferase [Psychromonas aquimarina]